MSAIFGPAGNADSFKALGYKSNTDAPEYVSKMKLDLYEYQCGRGVKVSAENAAIYRENAEKFGIKTSLHAPYFISLSSVEEDKRLKSVDYILQSAKAADMLGANRIVVHSGSCSKITREEALEKAKDTLKIARKALIDNNLEHIHICPETMGKINQLGTLEEVLELCLVDDSFIPCIDFGHLNCRTFGKMNSYNDFENALNLVENKLGADRLKSFHSHFSKIEWTENGGEKKHLTFADNIYGPEFEPLGELIAKKNLSPYIICESAGTQAEDAKFMKKIYNSFKTM